MIINSVSNIYYRNECSYKPIFKGNFAEYLKKFYNASNVPTRLTVGSIIAKNKAEKEGIFKTATDALEDIAKGVKDTKRFQSRGFMGILDDKVDRHIDKNYGDINI